MLIELSNRSPETAYFVGRQTPKFSTSLQEVVDRFMPVPEKS